MINTIHYSSKTVIWETPQPFFDALNAEFGFDTDVCALPENAKCERYFSPEQDGLSQKWEGICWMNPPYGRVLRDWVKKAWVSSMYGATVVCLIPARTDTSYWHDYIIGEKAEVRFIRGRLKFGNAKNSAPFPSAVVIFRPRKAVTNQ